MEKVWSQLVFTNSDFVGRALARPPRRFSLPRPLRLASLLSFACPPRSAHAMLSFHLQRSRPCTLNLVAVRLQAILCNMWPSRLPSDEERWGITIGVFIRREASIGSSGWNVCAGKFMAPGITAWCDRTMADVRLLDTGYFEMGRASRSVRRTSTTNEVHNGGLCGDQLVQRIRRYVKWVRVRIWERQCPSVGSPPIKLEVRKNIPPSCQSQVIHSNVLVKFVKLRPN